MENYLENITNNFTIFEKELSKSKCLNEFVNKLELYYKSAIDGIVEGDESRSKLETLVLHGRVYKFFELIDGHDPLVGKSRELNPLSSDERIFEKEKYLSMNRLFDVLIYFSMDLSHIKNPSLEKKLTNDAVEELCNLRKEFLNKYLI